MLLPKWISFHNIVLNYEVFTFYCSCLKFCYLVISRTLFLIHGRPTPTVVIFVGNKKLSKIDGNNGWNKYVLSQIITETMLRGLPF